MSKIIVDDDGIMHDVIEIPKGITNGDFLKSIFPSLKISDYSFHYMLVEAKTHSYLIPKLWWNTSYKKEINYD